MGWLRLKFIIVVMAAIAAVSIGFLLTIERLMTDASIEVFRTSMEELLASDGKTSGKTNYSLTDPANSVASVPTISYFSVKVGHGGEILEIFSNDLPDFTDAIAAEYLDAARRNESAGEYQLGGFRWNVAEKPYGKLYVFIRRTRDRIMLWELLALSRSLILAIDLLAIALTVGLAFWAYAPVKRAFDGQRRFVSDVSHELKTPLAVIGTNIDLMESEFGRNKGIDALRLQCARMGQLVSDLLTLSWATEKHHAMGMLSRFRATRRLKKMPSFNLSEVVNMTALEFESRAFDEAKPYEIHVKAGIAMNGDAGKIKRLLGNLIENALKYSDAGDRIEVSLANSRRGGAVLSVFNTGKGIPEEERDKIFDRFYRSDHSRTRATGGYGLGLAIVKSIAEFHGGRMEIEGVTGEWVRFLARF